MRHTHTHTYAILEISRAAYDEIREKLRIAGYTDQFHQSDEYEGVVDMHGIAIAPVPMEEEHGPVSS